MIDDYRLSFDRIDDILSVSSGDDVIRRCTGRLRSIIGIGAGVDAIRIGRGRIVDGRTRIIGRIRSRNFSLEIFRFLRGQW